MTKLRTVFMGTPEFSIKPLEVLIENTEVVLVVTQPDKLVGRHKVLTPSVVKQLALKNNIEVFQPVKIRQDYQKIIDLKPDLIITCAYGQIIPKELLECAKYKAINIHASILPKYRGSAPINWAIINGDKKTGITLMYMDEHMDTGDIIKIAETDIKETDTYGSLYERLSLIGAELLKENLDYITSDNVVRIKQNDEESTLAPMIKRETEHIDFSLEGNSIINKIRGLNPNPYAYTIINNEEIKIIDAYFEKKEPTNQSKIMEITKKSLGIGCKNGIIYITKVKPAGKKEMDIVNYLNGVDKDKLKNNQVG